MKIELIDTKNFSAKENLTVKLITPERLEKAKFKKNTKKSCI